MMVREVVADSDKVCFCSEGYYVFENDQALKIIIDKPNPAILCAAIVLLIFIIIIVVIIFGFLLDKITSK